MLVSLIGRKMVFFALLRVLRGASGCGVPACASPQIFVRPKAEPKIHISDFFIIVHGDGPLFTVPDLPFFSASATVDRRYD